MPTFCSGKMKQLTLAAICCGGLFGKPRCCDRDPMVLLPISDGNLRNHQRSPGHICSYVCECPQKLNPKTLDDNSFFDHCSTQEVHRCLTTHLLSWQHLAGLSAQRNMFLFKMRPKHHFMFHIKEDLKRTLLNPQRVQSCHSDESFLGCIKRVGVACHQMSMLTRLYQRYLLFLSVRWKDTAQGRNQ